MKLSRWLWLITGSLVAIVMLGVGVAYAVNQLARNEYTSEQTIPAEQLEALDVRTDNGDITIVGADRSDVRVVVNVDEGLRKPRISDERHGGRLSLASDCPMIFNGHCTVDYEIEVPRRMVIDVRAMNGDLVVRSVNGDVKARGSNGAVRVEDLSGRIDAVTRNGSIGGNHLLSTHAQLRTDNGSVNLNFVNPVDAVDAITVNGDVKVQVPSTSDAYRVQVSTTNGSTNSNVRSDPASERRITARSVNGRIAVSYPNPE